MWENNKMMEDIVRVWATFCWAEILGPLIHVEEMSGHTGHNIEDQVHTFMAMILI